MNLFTASIYLIISIFLAGTADAAPEMFVISGLDHTGVEVSPQWEPESGRVAYLKENVFVIYDVKSSDPAIPITLKATPDSADIFRQLAFAWSPLSDHRFALFASDREGRLGLYLGQDYSLRRKLLDFPQGGGGIRFGKLSFSSDGKNILYSYNGALYKISSQLPAAPERLIKNELLPANSGAQSWGVYNPRYKDIVAFELETEGMEALYFFHCGLKKIIGSIKGEFSASHPSWSPDGKKLAFFSSHQDTKDKESGPDSEISWKLCYINYNHNREEIGPINVVSANDSIRKKAAAADFTPICWTPDSKRLIFSSYGRENNNKLAIADLQTGKINKISIGDKITIKSSRGHSTSWNMKLIYSDISCACIDKNCYLAFAADVDIGHPQSRIIIKDINLNNH